MGLGWQLFRVKLTLVILARNSNDAILERVYLVLTFVRFKSLENSRKSMSTRKNIHSLYFKHIFGAIQDATAGKVLLKILILFTLTDIFVVTNKFPY